MILDRYAGITEELVHDEATDTFGIRQTADLTALLDRNTRLRNEGRGMSKSGEWQRVASIPVWVHNLWKNLYGTDPLAKGNEKLLSSLLNDPQFRGLRTSSGRV